MNVIQKLFFCFLISGVLCVCPTAFSPPDLQSGAVAASTGSNNDIKFTQQLNTYSYILTSTLYAIPSVAIATCYLEGPLRSDQYYSVSTNSTQQSSSSLQFIVNISYSLNSWSTIKFTFVATTRQDFDVGQLSGNIPTVGSQPQTISKQLTKNIQSPTILVFFAGLGFSSINFDSIILPLTLNILSRQIIGGNLQLLVSSNFVSTLYLGYIVYNPTIVQTNFVILMGDTRNTNLNVNPQQSMKQLNVYVIGISDISHPSKSQISFEVKISNNFSLQTSSATNTTLTSTYLLIQNQPQLYCTGCGSGNLYDGSGCVSTCTGNSAPQQITSTYAVCRDCGIQQYMVVDPNKTKCMCADQCYQTSPSSCQPCHYSCASCSGPNSNNCLTCDLVPAVGTNRYLLGNQCTCVSGFYDDAISGSCLACAYTCLTCNGTGSSNCVSCNTTANRYLSNAQCLCNAGYVDNGVNATCACQSFLPNGLCSAPTPPSTPTLCPLNSALINNQCQCSSNFINSSNICVACPSNSLKFSQTECRCQQGYVNISNACVTCPTNYIIVNGQCQCPPNTVLLSGACVACPVNSVINSSNQCECSANYVNVSGQCTLCPLNSIKVNAMSCQCRDGFANSSGICIACPANSTILNGQCICASNTILKQNACQSCPSNSIIVNSSCQCISNFVNISGVCTQCPWNSMIQNGQCQCPSNTILIAGVCQSCSNNSTVVSGQCKCLNNFVNISGTCTACPNNSQVINNECQCQNGFTNVSGQCIGCPINSVYIDGICQCPSNAILLSGVCTVCPQNSSPQNNQCKCMTGIFKINGICTLCPNGQYFDGNVCQPCTNGYNVLVSQGVQGCNCNSGFYLMGGVCSQCVAGTETYDSSSKSCVCLSGYTRVSGKCQTTIITPPPPSSNQTQNQTTNPINTTNNNIPPNTIIVNGQVVCASQTYNVSGVCRFCSSNENQQKNTCVCKSNFVKIGLYCQKLGTNEIYNGTGVTCRQGFVNVSGHCSTCKDNYNSTTQTCDCPNGSSRINNQCRSNQGCPSNSYLVRNQQCACVPGTYNMSGMCIFCPANSVYRGMSCVCNQGYSNISGVCRCPDNSGYNGQACTCNDGFITSPGGGCMTCPDGSIWDGKVSCVCSQGFTFTGTSCINSGNNNGNNNSLTNICPTNSAFTNGRCRCNQGYTQSSNGCTSTPTICPIGTQLTLNGCSCITPNTILINGSCRSCPQNSNYNGITCACQLGIYNAQTNICVYCSPPTVLIGTNCTCPQPNQIYNNGACYNCSSTCQTCSAPTEDACLTCLNPQLQPVNGKCVVSPTNCPKSTFYNNLTNACQSCSAFCASCSYASKCDICLDGFNLIANVCVEICGDGRRFQVACDDGNKISGDGCSSDCQIQSGWNCSGGNALTRDTCSRITQSNLKPFSITVRDMYHVQGLIIIAVQMSYIPTEYLANGCVSCSALINTTVIQADVMPTIQTGYSPPNIFGILYNFNGVDVQTPFHVSIGINDTLKYLYKDYDISQPLLLTIDPRLIPISS